MKVRLLSAVVLLGVLGAVFIPEKSQAFQPEGDGGDEAPTTCGYSMVSDASKSGKWFLSVPMTRKAAAYLSSHMDFVADNIPLSNDRKFIWVDAGGTFDCSRINLPFGIYFDKYVAYLLIGAVLPAPAGLEDAPTPPPSGTGGGTSYQWQPPTTSKVACMVTDWYENGVYTDTTVEYCWSYQ